VDVQNVKTEEWVNLEVEYHPGVGVVFSFNDKSAHLIENHVWDALTAYIERERARFGPTPALVPSDN